MRNVIAFPIGKVISFSSADEKMSMAQECPDKFQIFRAQDGTVLVFRTEQLELYKFFCFYYKQKYFH
jgi:hypothetical protein